LVMSDTHDLEITSDGPAYSTAKSQSLKVDVLLHCGDLTLRGGLESYKKVLRLLGSFDAELKLVIAGNHDLSLDGECWKAHMNEKKDSVEHEEAVEIMTGPLAKEAGVTYLTEGLHRFTLQDGRSFSVYASPYQPECGNWAFGYARTEDRFSIPPAPGMRSIAQHAIPESVDIVMTHGPPRGILDLIPDRNEHAGCDAIRHAVQRVRPLMHCFGHIHEGHGVQVKAWDCSFQMDFRVVKVREAGTKKAWKTFELTPGSDTLMVNAAVMDESNSPMQAPWIVEPQLPRKKS
jgi:hypothetical protein